MALTMPSSCSRSWLRAADDQTMGFQVFDGLGQVS